MHSVPAAFLTPDKRVLFGISSQPQYAIGLRCADDTGTAIFVIIVNSNKITDDIYSAGNNHAIFLVYIS